MSLLFLSGCLKYPRFQDPIKKKKRIVAVNKPKCNNLSVLYKHMGGVDFMDSVIERYRIIMRSEKW